MKKSSTHHDHQEVDLQPKHENGIGRSYECVFCKRGFNTAQALGGHMNIHRKDRIRNRSNQNQHAVAAYLNCRTYIPAHSSTSTIRINHHNNGSEVNTNNQQCLNLLGLSLQFGAAAGHVVELENMEENKGTTEDDLDLELRLGH
ncbi:hypothetical protein HAX54_023603 [Datura stramonium]|uniref:C2H2-type domain-containing protein n=1 Tax=Datura stramonium TaxID=4076 RepID=A0ABS8Y9A4_DATST|nr:hypothetical protein [Datura stramonium]